MFPSKIRISSRKNIRSISPSLNIQSSTFLKPQGVVRISPSNSHQLGQAFKLRHSTAQTEDLQLKQLLEQLEDFKTREGKLKEDMGKQKSFLQSNYEDQISILSQKLEVETIKNKSLAKKSRDDQKENENLKLSLLAKDKRIKELESLTEAMESRYEQAESKNEKISPLRRKLLTQVEISEKLKDEILTKKSQLCQLKTLVSEYKDKDLTLRSKISDLQLELSYPESQQKPSNKSLCQELEKLKVTNKSIIEQHKTLKIENRKTLQSLIDELYFLKNELSLIRKERTILKSSVIQLTSKINTKENIVQKLKINLKELDLKYKSILFSRDFAL